MPSPAAMAAMTLSAASTRPSTGTWSVPNLVEPVGRHRRVNDRVADIPVPEKMLQAPRIEALIGERIAGGVPQHVRVDLERRQPWHPRRNAPQRLPEPHVGHRLAALVDKNKPADLVPALQPAQS